ncbi:MAG TPA: biotin--[acetyl-CoA-carboxylase] ligase [Fimbriimonadaceae bacterium]|nr:biotin--[acetyl-CoA-carboxylase] ligase [Fimbriimonadaceae bacterium]
MKSPLEDGAWHRYEEVLSTQDLAANEVKRGRGGVFLATNQTLGRGRLGREWISQAGDSLTLSMAFMAYADHPKPYLIGMAIAAAAAAVLHCEVAWPNDLVSDGHKLGGVLTELVVDDKGRRVPVVGVGINLNQRTFPPEIKEFAASLAMVHGGVYVPVAVAESLIARLASIPEPNEWCDIAPVWSLFDHTPGKRYRTLDGAEAIALGVGPEGQLMCSVNGETTSIMAADAIFGNPGNGE